MKLPTSEAEMNRALVVDDDRRIRDLVEGYLSSDDLEVDAADDGVEAIRRLRQRDYDLILLDLMMPGLSGFAVLEFLQNEKPTLLERVVVMTGRKLTGEPRIVRIDFTGRLLHKPFTRKDLSTVATRILRSSG